MPWTVVSHHVGAGKQTQRKQSVGLTAVPAISPAPVFGSSLPTLNSRLCEKPAPGHMGLG